MMIFPLRYFLVLDSPFVWSSSDLVNTAFKATSIPDPRITIVTTCTYHLCRINQAFGCFFLELSVLVPFASNIGDLIWTFLCTPRTQPWSIRHSVWERGCRPLGPVCYYPFYPSKFRNIYQLRPNDSLSYQSLTQEVRCEPSRALSSHVLGISIAPSLMVSLPTHELNYNRSPATLFLLDPSRPLFHHQSPCHGSRKPRPTRLRAVVPFLNLNQSGGHCINERPSTTLRSILS
ncbi:hypothetical protein B0J11DRAFT_306517 [Dendryphion nanum]|uniref:Uncharacterized protein n=1 Tax=Dendryphion nanum TaxID=256645 RepID=A0A9P9IM15_9PLEO|nr:hypothetical protein B0J11DRAFT_306517 [Dendryphion nanum]